MEQNKRSGRINKPAFFMLAFLFIIFNTIFIPSELPMLPLLGGVDLAITDILIIMLMGLAIQSRLFNNPTVVKTPLSKYVVIMLMIIFMGGVFSILAYGQAVLTVFANMRSFIGYLLFFPVIWCLGTMRGVEKIINLWVLLAIIGALFYIYTFSFGEPGFFQTRDWLFSRIAGVTTGGGESEIDIGFSRIMSQGTILFRIVLFVSIMFWLSSKGRARWLWGGIAALLAFQVVIQFTRGMYVTSLFMLIVMAYLIKDPKARGRLISVIGLCVFVGSLAILFYTGFDLGSEGSVFSFAGDRLMRTFTHSEEDQSIQSRILIYSTMLTYMEGRWLFGIGLGGGVIYGDNTFVSFVLKTGLLGLASFLFLSITACYRGYKGFKMLTDPWQQAIVLALWVSTVRHLINGLTQADFTDSARVPALIISIALMEVVIFRARQSSVFNKKAEVNHEPKTEASYILKNTRLVSRRNETKEAG